MGSYNDLGLITPGLQTSRRVGAAIPYLRGIGAQSTSVGIEGATWMYLDGVYVSGNVDAILTLNNIEPIKVLKVSRCTLFSLSALNLNIQILMIVSLIHQASVALDPLCTSNIHFFGDIPTNWRDYFQCLCVDGSVK